MKPLFLFVRPPRPLWPFNGPTTAFWPPLAFASMAAALRESLPNIRVGILDAPALSMGWNTLTEQLKSLKPDYLGIGEEAVGCVEGLRIAKLAKEIGARVIAGGCFFSQVAPQVLATGLIDIVVHGEGEVTIVEMLRALLEGDANSLRAVAGLSFLDGEKVVFTGFREPMADLDRLPFPAYDLLPVGKYGARSFSHPALASIELGRGCSHGCQFCVLWRHMGRFKADHPVPYLRVKSAQRLLEEIRILMDRFGRRYLGWVDPCFNADPNVPAQLAELLLREGRVIGQSAWVRADYVLRDDSSGALKLCYRSGCNDAYLGIERIESAELARLGKGNLNGESVRALEVLDQKYPEIVTVGTFIYGFPWDTPESVRRLFRGAQQLPLDEIFFIPSTPLPGTPAWRPGMWDPTGEVFRSFDFLPRPGPDEFLSRLSAEIGRSYLLCWPRQRVRRMLRGLVARNPRRRRITRHILQRSMPMLSSTALWRAQTFRLGMTYPAWYES
jgi:anaerobic magnesium-protoporphyrin IX monomethyl ester cyclase